MPKCVRKRFLTWVEIKPINVNRVKTAAVRFYNSVGSMRDSLKVCNGNFGAFSLIYALVL